MTVRVLEVGLIYIFLKQKTIDHNWTSIVSTFHVTVCYAHDDRWDKQHNSVVNRADTYVWHKWQVNPVPTLSQHMINVCVCHMCSQLAVARIESGPRVSQWLVGAEQALLSPRPNVADLPPVIMVISYHLQLKNSCVGHHMSCVSWASSSDVKAVVYSP